MENITNFTNTMFLLLGSVVLYDIWKVVNQLIESHMYMPFSIQTGVIELTTNYRTQ